MPASSNPDSLCGSNGGDEILSSLNPSKGFAFSPRPGGATILCRLAWDRIADVLKLSPRELQVVQGIFDDKTELAIASSLGLSTSTVHTYTERIYHKLDVRDRVQLVICVVRSFLDLCVSDSDALPPICHRASSGQCPWYH
ncbi:response regulator transcription factor [Haloferula sp.]|uniref:response regulator transcription factor n=1 Tax=Haloferula sp. TaxID=2497595 RepID=UPI003C714ECB